MSENHNIDADTRDVLDNPEWSAEDLRSGKTLSDFAPALAAKMRRDLKRGKPQRTASKTPGPSSQEAE